ncbi:MAG: hypothetical protein OEZ23_02250 [Gammaproteobacteria bacterium]|nr:hypothetical protein [Gammaproteobacteria bacterium]
MLWSHGLALGLIWSYPLTPERHARLRERMARKAQRQEKLLNEGTIVN